jgi:hypothetical protein
MNLLERLVDPAHVIPDLDLSRSAFFAESFNHPHHVPDGRETGKQADPE